MFPNPITPTVHIPHSDTLLRRLFGGMSFFTMLITIPGLDHMVRSSGRRVFAVIVECYLVSAVLWFWFGIQKHHKNIYLPCVGWMVLDSAVIMESLSMDK